MTPFEAARLLYRSGDLEGAESLLKALWAQSTPEDESFFRVLCAMLEVGIARDPRSVQALLDSLIAGEGHFQHVWSARTLPQQAVLFDWHGHLSFLLNDQQNAFDSLTRAASLGRDTSVLWFQLGMLFIDDGDLELSVRYAKRSLQLFKQLDLSLVPDQSEDLGAFGGHHPMRHLHGIEGYMDLLLKATRLAKGAKGLKMVRELIVEMIHQFPEELRLPKIRLLMERNIVSGALQQPFINSQI